MALNLDHLVGYQRASFERAALWRNWTLLGQLLVAIPGVLSIFVTDEQFLYLLAIGGFVLLILVGIFNRNYQHHRNGAETARRATLIIEGVDHHVTAEEKKTLLEQMSVSSKIAAEKNDPNWFATKEPASQKRLLEIIEESSFFTRYLQSTSALVMGTVFALTVIILIVAIFTLIPMSETETLVVVARLALAILVFLLSSGTLFSALAHFSAWNSAKTIQSRANLAKVRGAGLADTLLIMGDYNSAVEQAPMVVPFVYKFHAKALNERWNDYLEQREKDAAASTTT
ncbi:MAG: hypothetical protein HRT81_17035 [Henriciella sp.]|nr:hypothetical protein [Henriciella sp.]